MKLRGVLTRVPVAMAFAAVLAMLIVPAASSTASAAGGLDHFVIGVVSGQTAGNGFTVTATAVDNSGNPLGSRYHGTPTLSGNLGNSARGCGTGGSSACTPVYSNPPAVLNGVATWTGVTAYKAETGRTVTASDSGKTGTSNTFAVGANVPDKLTFVQQPTDAQPNASIAPAVQVLNEDHFGNPEVGVAVTIGLTPGTNASGGTLSGTLTQSGDSTTGVSTFGDLKINTLQSDRKLRATSGSAQQDSAFFNTANIVSTCSGSCTVNTSDEFANITVTVTGGSAFRMPSAVGTASALPGNVSITLELPRATCSNITNPLATGDLVTVNPVGVSGVVEVSGVLLHRNNGGGVGNFNFCKNSGPQTAYNLVPDCNKKKTNTPCMVKVNGFGSGDVEFRMRLKQNADGTWDPALSGGH